MSVAPLLVATLWHGNS